MNSDVNNLALQPTAVVDAQVAPLPELPDALLQLDGVKEWWDGMKLNRERDKETLYRLILTRSGLSGGRGGGSGLSRITAIGRANLTSIANVAISSATTNTAGSTTTTNVTTSNPDALLLAWIGL